VGWSFFWCLFSDGIGHYKGIEAQKSSVIHFDSMLTPLVPLCGEFALTA